MIKNTLKLGFLVSIISLHSSLPSFAMDPMEEERQNFTRAKTSPGGTRGALMQLQSNELGKIPAVSKKLTKIGQDMNREKVFTGRGYIEPRPSWEWLHLSLGNVSKFFNFS